MTLEEIIKHYRETHVELNPNNNIFKIIDAAEKSIKLEKMVNANESFIFQCGVNAGNQELQIHKLTKENEKLKGDLEIISTTYDHLNLDRTRLIIENQKLTEENEALKVSLEGESKALAEVFENKAGVSIEVFHEVMAENEAMRETLSWISKEESCIDQPWKLQEKAREVLERFKK